MAQDSLLTIDKGNVTQTRTGVAIAFIKSNAAALGPQSSGVQSLFSFGPLDDRELEIFISKSNSACVFHFFGS